ncbi:MAG: putative 4-hydroxybenzoate polyprenyltransferase [Bacteroidota bacterium]|nr:putative 4-hydroxybenzoate polyprenyltransferase [Bacteroidota bacterium]
MKAYLSLIKFTHTIFALPFALLAFFLGLEATGGQFKWQLLGLVVLCMIFARSAAMAFNRYIDRGFDARNARTIVREIPAGTIKPAAAIRFVLLMSIAFIFTTYWINPLCFYLSPVALAVILGYSYTKRFTWLCHFVLGVGLGLAPIGAYIAVTGYFHLLPVLYGIMVMLWVSGFDIVYALQDADFDRVNDLHSIPARFGKKTANQISIVLHIFCACLLLYITFFQAQVFSSFQFLHWIGAIGFVCLLFWQHHLVKLYDLSRINQAFFETNGIASILFGSTVILDILI